MSRPKNDLRHISPQDANGTVKSLSSQHRRRVSRPPPPITPLNRYRLAVVETFCNHRLAVWALGVQVRHFHDSLNYRRELRWTIV